MSGYRLYFLDALGCVFARQEFVAPNDGTAIRIAFVLGEATGEAHHGYALWQESRELYDTTKHSRGYARGLAASRLDKAAQEIVIGLEETILDSKAGITRSEKLLHAHRELVGKRDRKAS
jgi:hypothetical protein